MASKCKVGTKCKGFVVKTRRSNHASRRVKYWAKCTVAKTKHTKKPLTGGRTPRVVYGVPGEVHDVEVDGLMWGIRYDATLQPTYAYTGDMDALRRGGNYPPDTGIINFVHDVAQGFPGTNYNPTNIAFIRMSNVPSRETFHQALVALS